MSRSRTRKRAASSSNGALPCLEQSCSCTHPPIQTSHNQPQPQINLLFKKYLASDSPPVFDAPPLPSPFHLISSFFNTRYPPQPTLHPRHPAHPHPHPHPSPLRIHFCTKPPDPRVPPHSTQTSPSPIPFPIPHPRHSVIVLSFWRRLQKCNLFWSAKGTFCVISVVLRVLVLVPSPTLASWLHSLHVFMGIISGVAHATFTCFDREVNGLYCCNRFARGLPQCMVVLRFQGNTLGGVLLRRGF